MPTQPDLNAAALTSVWGRRTLDLPVKLFDITRPISPEDIAFLAHRSVYIQMINSKAVLSGMTEALLVRTEEGWTVHDYGEAMSVSPGESLFESEEGKGTVVNQAVGVAHKMVTMAIEKGWAGIEVISGVRLIEWAVWHAAQDQQFEVFGFKPTKEEQQRRRRIKTLGGADIKTPAAPLADNSPPT